MKTKVKAREVGRRMREIRHHRGIIGDIARSIAREASRRIVVARSSSKSQPSTNRMEVFDLRVR